MASHLAAQDYLNRLQASGLNFPTPDLQYPLLTPPHVPKSSSKSQKSSTKKDKLNSTMTSPIASTSSANSNYQKSVSSNYNSHKNFLTNTSYNSSKSDRISSSPLMSSSSKMKQQKPPTVLPKEITLHAVNPNKPILPQPSVTPPPRPRDSPASMTFLR